MGVDASIERIWTGALSPILAWDGAAYVACGFTRTGWQRPMSVLTPLLAAQVSAATGATVTIIVEADRNLSLTASAPIKLALLPGFAAHIGWATSYPSTSSIHGTGQRYAIRDQRWSLGLPVLVWHRQTSGPYAVVWDGPFRCLDVLLMAHYRASEPFDPRRCPIILYRSDTAWSLSHLDGWLALRPLGETSQRDWMIRGSGDFESGTTRYLILEGSHA